MSPGNSGIPEIIGRHPAMREVYRMIRLAATATLPVVIVGETGTGKELVARAVHRAGTRREGPFVDLNCAAIPDNLAEAELFGWERGAFTGAHRRMPGLLEAADNGTLFLDEASSLSLGLQAKLLRALELGTFRRVGGRPLLSAMFRIVVAVTEPVQSLVAAGRMREDFAYRIGGITIDLPPLRLRGQDLHLLANHFLNAANHNGHPKKSLHPSALDQLRHHRWPGNVRELQMVIERLAICVEGPTITASHVLQGMATPRLGPMPRESLEGALVAHSWDVARTARSLGIGRTTLYALMRRQGLRRPPTLA